MKFKLINNEKIWNQFLLQNNPMSFFQSWEWGQVQQKETVKIWRYGFYQQQHLIGVAQIFLIKAKRGCFLHVRHGPVLLQKNCYKIKYWIEIINFLKKLAKTEQAFFIRISPMIIPTIQTKKIIKAIQSHNAPIHTMDAELCWVLDLTKSETELLASMRKTTRYLIKQAQKLGVVVTKSENINDFLNLYKLTSQRHHFVPHQGITNEFEIFNKKNNAILLIAKYQKQILAAAVIIFWGKQAIYHHGASLSGKIPASYLLQWKAIQLAKSRGCKFYNFWGIAPITTNNHPWKGLTIFKTGFGGYQLQYLHAQDIVVSIFYMLPFLIEKIRKIIKGY